MVGKFSRRLLLACIVCLLVGGRTAVVAQDAAEFSLVVLPDTQNYSEKFPETYLAQTRWIKARAKSDNIQFVIHLGDIVQNAAVEGEWKVADQAHRMLDGTVPYSVVPGNHDMDTKDKKLLRTTALYDRFFSPERFASSPWYGGHKDANNQNNYCLFEASGLKFIVLSLEFGPTDETLQWAADVLRQYSDRRAILATHCYMRPKGRDKQGPQGFGLNGNSGEQMWEKLVRKQANVFLVLSGHVLGVAHQISVNDAGGQVHEVLVDYQGLPNGGDGWLQVLRFVPTENRIDVRAYSPVLDKSNTDPAHSYSLDYVMSTGN